MKSNVTIEMSQIGTGRVLIGDMDLSKYTKAIKVEVVAGELLKVELLISAGVEIRGPAEVSGVLEKLNVDEDGLVDATTVACTEFREYEIGPKQ